MSRRIDVELTSRREDGSWTWRAAGAREPKGTVEESMLPDGAKVGDMLKVEIETFIDGIAILGVMHERSSRNEPQRLELLGPARPERLVTTTLAPRGRGDRSDRGGGDRDRPRRPRDDADGGRRPAPRDGERRERRPRDGDDGARRGRPGGERREPIDQKPKPKRLRPGRTHRRELIAELPEEQRPIAEELAKGGIPGVRAALDAQNEQAKTEGKPEINPEPLLALAEGLWPRMRTAEWRDRAEAAIGEVDELDLRDLRSVVVGADSAARDDETRALAAQLREALTRRVDEEHTKWLTELAELVAENRIVAALRRSSRPPKAGAPLPSDLARLLTDRTAESLHAEAGTERWSVVLDALSFSPVRSSVTPASVPEHPSDELLAAVRRAAPRLPHIAALFGIEAPAAPPPQARGGRRTGGGRGGAAGGGRRNERPGSTPDPQAAAPSPAPQDAGGGVTSSSEADADATVASASSDTDTAIVATNDAPTGETDGASDAESMAPPSPVETTESSPAAGSSETDSSDTDSSDTDSSDTDSSDTDSSESGTSEVGASETGDAGALGEGSSGEEPSSEPVASSPSVADATSADDRMGSEQSAPVADEAHRHEPSEGESRPQGESPVAVGEPAEQPQH